MEAAHTSIPNEVEAWRATLWFLVSIRRFSELAPRQSLAVNLQSADLREAFQRGEYPKGDWKQAAIEDAREHGLALRRSMYLSLAAVLLFGLLGLLVAAGLGAVSHELPISWSKVLSLVGASLAAWGTVLQIGGYAESWKGRNLYEIIRPILFRAIFLPGLFLATTGVLL